MQINYILYYLIRLVNKGKEWKNKDLNGKETGRFHILQVLSLILAALYVWKRPEGMSENKELIDYILSSLSITTALLFSIIVVVLDRARQHKFEGTTEKEKLNDIHQWNHLYQFASITGNAILWSLLVVVLLICSMLFGHDYNLSNYEFVGWSELKSWECIKNFLVYALVIGVRFVIVYGLFNFFVLFLFSLLSLFESIISELDVKKPQVQISSEMMGTVELELNKLISPCRRRSLFILCILVLVVAIMYLFDKL